MYTWKCIQNLSRRLYGPPLKPFLVWIFLNTFIVLSPAHFEGSEPSKLAGNRTIGPMHEEKILGNTILHIQTRFTVFPNPNPKCIRPTATKFSIRSYTIKWVCLTLVTIKFVTIGYIYLYWPLFLNWYKICRLLIILSVKGVCFHLTNNYHYKSYIITIIVISMKT